MYFLVSLKSPTCRATYTYYTYTHKLYMYVFVVCLSLCAHVKKLLINTEPGSPRSKDKHFTNKVLEC